MDKICHYSTIIFASNVSVLLIVAITTDYWEYRDFDMDVLTNKLRQANRTKVVKPSDTDTYVMIRFFWDGKKAKQGLPSFPGNITYYQPPAVLHRYLELRSVQERIVLFNGTHNVSASQWRVQTVRSQDVLVLYLQYGNTFRDCDNLEGGVRLRLGMNRFRSNRCLNFIFSARNSTDFICHDVPAVIHLERVAFLLCSVCVVASVISVIGGAYGSIMHDQKATLTASTSALTSAMSLTVAIAIFHGKCHLLHRRELLEGIDIPYKKVLDESRMYHFGWSFVLAWICVVLCFIHTWVWLLQAQDMPAFTYSIRSHRIVTQELCYTWEENHGTALEDSDVDEC